MCAPGRPFQSARATRLIDRIPAPFTAPVKGNGMDRRFRKTPRSRAPLQSRFHRISDRRDGFHLPSPYDKENTAQFGRSAAERGFVVVVQDVRGRYESEGEWTRSSMKLRMGTMESEIGPPHCRIRTVRWAVRRLLCVGVTQMLAAVSHSPHLAGICPGSDGQQLPQNSTYQGGEVSNGEVSTSPGPRDWLS